VRHGGEYNRKQSNSCHPFWIDWFVNTVFLIERRDVMFVFDTASTLYAGCRQHLTAVSYEVLVSAGCIHPHSDVFGLDSCIPAYLPHVGHCHFPLATSYPATCPLIVPGTTKGYHALLHRQVDALRGTGEPVLATIGR
jgi:hypothetical protein